MLTLKDFTFDPNRPFANDPLKREDIANNLTRLIEKTPGPAVLTLSASWGQGKTTFGKQWRSHLNNQGFQTYWFNAWAEDFTSDPLSAFMGELLSQVDAASESSTDGPSRAKKLLLKSSRFIKDLALASPSILVAHATKSIVQLPTDDDIDNETDPEATALSKVIGAYVSQRLEAQQNAKGALESFKHTLREFVDASSDGKPVVIFIDELDRCRPTFAIELIEVIKHFFSVEGIIFVLAVDRQQIAHAAASLLGFPIENAEGYLRRFIDLNFDLPQPSLDKYSDFLRPHLPNPLADGSLRSMYRNLALVSQARGLSLREFRAASLRTSIGQAVYGNLLWQYACAIAVGVFFEAWKPGVFSRAAAEMDCEQLLEILDLSSTEEVERASSKLMDFTRWMFGEKTGRTEQQPFADFYDSGSAVQTVLALVEFTRGFADEE
ncbi:MAG: P-loop NTPase fold protein [Planctomycetota bacterium]